MQLNKYIAHCGVTSRRGAVSIIENERVHVNDIIVTEPGFKVQVGTDVVCVDGNRLDIQAELVYILLNKPVDTITTVSDEQGRKTVMELIDIDERIYPVGRLDRDTTGVLVLTNDGELAYRLAHPKFEVKKIYRAEVDGIPESSIITELKKGVEIEPGIFVRGEAQILDKKVSTSIVEISIHQGKKHQVKKMLWAVGHPVINLDRICFAGLTTGNLDPGEWRRLTDTEVDNLYTLVDLKINRE